MPVRRVPLQSRSRASRRVSPAVHGAHSGARERVVSHRGAVCGALFGFHCRFVQYATRMSLNLRAARYEVVSQTYENTGSLDGLVTHARGGDI